MPVPEIRQLTPDGARFNLPDLQALLVVPDQNLRSTLTRVSSLGAIRADVPGRPGLTLQWANLHEVGDTDNPQTYRPITFDNAESHVRDYETTLSVLALTGADTPRHTTYVVGQDESTHRPARLYTIAQRPEGQYLHGNAHKPGTELHRRLLRVARVIFTHHTAPSIRPWRIEVAGAIPAYTHSNLHEGLEMSDLSPALIEPRHAATVALNGLLFQLAPTAVHTGSNETSDLFSEITDYMMSNNLPIDLPK